MADLDCSITRLLNNQKSTEECAEVILRHCKTLRTWSYIHTDEFGGMVKVPVLRELKKFFREKELRLAGTCEVHKNRDDFDRKDIDWLNREMETEGWHKFMLCIL